ncbi:MAG: hypothetical protein P4M09_21785 [Devosia sp.]|nr:hypothetical protein [Devosia sp.]
MRSLLPHPAMKAFAADKCGTVTILSAALIAGLIAMVSLVAEYGLNLERQNQDQRIADAASYAAALYYGANSGASNVLTVATSIAQNVAALNGVVSTCAGSSTTPPCVTATVVTSPANSNQSALKVTVSTSGTLFLSKVVGGASKLTTLASSYAQFGGSVSACITSLNASTGITLTGGTSISAPLCSVATNATLSVPCGTTITAKGVSYGGSAPSQGCSGITSPTLVHATVTDPLASNSGVIAAEAHVTGISTQTGPSAPTVTVPTTGTAVSFTLSSYPTTTQTSGGCTATYSSSTWTVSCPAGNYYITTLSLGGGLNLAWNPSGSSSSVYSFKNAYTTAATTTFGPGTYNFAGAITTAGTTTFAAGTYNFASTVTTAGTTTFGAGTYNFALGLANSGGSTTTFGVGTYNFGRSTSKCNGEGYFSICDVSTITFTGSSTFSLSSGVYVSGGSTLTMGTGTSNSFQIGAASDGNATWLGGGAILTLGATSGGSGVFQITGNVDSDAGGGSCMNLGAATNHDINGWFSTAGGTILGAGTYTINGYLAYGNNGGGSVSCSGSSVGLQGTGVTIIYNASSTPSSGTCKNMGLCFAAGFSNVSVSAPTSGTYSFLLFVGPQSNTAGVLMSGGSGASMSGAFYVPDSAFTMSGGAYINTITGGCLQIVANSVSMSGGTTAASTCISSGSTSTTPKLVM